MHKVGNKTECNNMHGERIKKDGSLAAEHIMSFRTVTVRIRGLTILGPHISPCRLPAFAICAGVPRNARG